MAQDIKVNLDTSKKKYILKECNQNDNITLEANIFENGIAKNIENAEVIINGTKADKTFVSQNTEITKSGNKITSELDIDFTRVEGITKIQIVLNENEKNNSTFEFNINVNPSVLNGAVESKNVATIIEKLTTVILEATGLKDEIVELLANGQVATDVELANAISTVNTALGTTNTKLTSTTAKADSWEKFKTDGILGTAGSVKGNNDGVTFGKNGVANSIVSVFNNASNNSLRPNVTNVMDLGGVSNRFKDFYSRTLNLLGANGHGIKITERFIESVGEALGFKAPGTTALYYYKNIPRNMSVLLPDGATTLGESVSPFRELWLGDVVKNDNGYTPLPNGMLLQWAKVVVPMAGEIDQLINLPIAFPTRMVYFGSNATKEGVYPNNVATSAESQGTASIKVGVRSVFTEQRNTSIYCFAIGF